MYVRTHTHTHTSLHLPFPQAKRPPEVQTNCSKEELLWLWTGWHHHRKQPSPSLSGPLCWAGGKGWVGRWGDLPTVRQAGWRGRSALQVWSRCACMYCVHVYCMYSTYSMYVLYSLYCMCACVLYVQYIQYVVCVVRWGGHTVLQFILWSTVNVLRLVTFVLAAIFLYRVREKATKTPHTHTQVAQVTVCHRSEHRAGLIGCQH